MARTKLHISTVLMAVLLASLVGFSAMMCLAEAFSMQCSMAKLAMVCGAASLAAACMMLPRRSWMLSLAALALWIAWILWKREPMEASLMALLHAVTKEYAACFPEIAVLGQQGDCLLILSAIAMPLCWLTAWIVCREGSILFLLLLCAPVLILCLIIVELAPVFWLVLLTFALLILLLSHSVRDRNANEGSRLAWWIWLPAVILVGAVTIIWPPADYERAEWSQTIQAMAESGLSVENLQQVTQAGADLISGGEFRVQEEDLSSLGPKRKNSREVLECKTDQRQFYLRAVSMGYYENNTWLVPDEASYAAANIYGQPLLAIHGVGEANELQIRTNGVRSLLYTTYHLDSVPGSVTFAGDYAVKNDGKLREYTVMYRSGSRTEGSDPYGYENYVNEYYTQIPDDLRRELQTLLKERQWDHVSDPKQLAALVQNSAVYDLNTPKIPEGEDFVLYFLRESNRGYCVHFATATVMLLRAKGIPARYVTGYSVSGTPGEWVTVTEDDAHAWVEYYVNGIGWVVLEPTPGLSSTQFTEPEVPSTQPQEPETMPEVTPQPGQTTTEPEQPEVPDEPEQEPPAAVVEEVSGDSWIWLLPIPAFALAVLLRRWLIVRGRNRRCSRGSPNRQALGLWRWLVALGKKTGLPPEEPLFRLAEKARFSQHTLTEEELSLLRQAADLRVEKLKQLPALRQFWLRYGLVLY